MRRAARIAAWGLLAVVVVAAGWLRLPYYGEGPGPSREIAPLIRIDGAERYDSGGTFVMTTVRWYQLTPLSALRVWLDDAWRIRSRDEIYPPGVDRDVEERRAVSEMDQSQLHATYVVLSRLSGYPDEAKGRGVLVESTYPGCPADGRLYPGDLVMSIDGEPVASSESLTATLGEMRVGVAFTVRIEVADEVREVELRRERCIEERTRAYVGAGFVDAFPFDVQMENQEVGGPSAGLMFALGLYDLLTPGDLTAGHTIAGTGALGLDGSVGPIGGIAEKAIAAERSGASIFLVPADNMDEVAGMGVGDLQLVPVATFDDALEALLDAGGEATLPEDAQVEPAAA